MAKITLNTHLNVETLKTLGKATQTEPVALTITNTELVRAADLPFPSEQDKWKIFVSTVEGETYDWFPNKICLKAFISALGSETEGWTNKEIKLYATNQIYNGKQMAVICAEVA